MSSPRHDFVSAKTQSCFGEDTFVSRRRHEHEVTIKFDKSALKSGESKLKLDEVRLKSGEGSKKSRENWLSSREIWMRSRVMPAMRAIVGKGFRLRGK